MTILHKIINAAVSQLPMDPREQCALIETVLRQLPRTVYWRLREQGFKPSGIIDIGAHEGNWTRMIRGIFPQTPVLMIEAREEQDPVLKSICSKQSDIDYVIALLGREAKEMVPFHVSGSGSSIFAERSDVPKTIRQVPMCALDDVISEAKPLGKTLLLKLDIQGAELECLLGGSGTLGATEIVQLEVALLNYNEAAPQAAEVISFMERNGFVMFDIAGFVRPNGINLVQVDIIFIKTTSKLRPNFLRFTAMP